ncbi:PPC domain-containing DNA-binding protein [Mariniblastus fucicola]|nr:PPC domain-containing DNA-binding protein [Mariniblastus fucicola]
MTNLHFPLLFLLTLFLFAGCSELPEQDMPQTRSYAIRLKPGEDLKKSIQKFVDDNQIEAGWIASCAGSLTDYHIRFANVPEGSKASGHFEIVSLSGTLSTNGSHIHVSVSDNTGKTIGGHLMDECLVYTTAEIVIQSASDLQFTRENDGTTEWKELQVKQKGEDVRDSD